MLELDMSSGICTKNSTPFQQGAASWQQQKHIKEAERPIVRL